MSVSMMPARLCPTCHHPGRLLAHSSSGAVVEYWRCDACGAVWSHDKRVTDSPAKPVTTPKLSERSG